MECFLINAIMEQALRAFAGTYDVIFQAQPAGVQAAFSAFSPTAVGKQARRPC